MAALCLFITLIQFHLSFSRISKEKCLTPKRYEYIVVGAGTAGSIVASELSKDYTVLLIEEGGWSSQWDIINNPANVFDTWFNPQLSRGYFSTPQPNLNNRIISQKRAKVTGGCNSHNALQYILGQLKDFEERWNIDNWKWKDLEPIWDHIQSTFKHTVIDPDGIWVKRFIESAEERGYQFTSEPNDLSNLPSDPLWIREAMGEVISSDLAQRETSWMAYIEPILQSRSNLDVLVYTRVNKILFRTEDRHGKSYPMPLAVGVETFGIGDERINNFYAAKDVILSAGSIDSPKILMLSGIGDCDYLNSLDIKCISNVPAVGKNLEDHFLAFIHSQPLKNQNTEVPKKLFGIPYGTFCMKDEGQYHIGLDIITGTDGIKSFEATIGVFQLNSRGEILLKDNEPSSLPIINPNYFKDKRDEKIWINAFKEARNLLNTNVLTPFYDQSADEILPGFDVDTDNKILEFGKNTFESYNHQSSTCKMGNEFNQNNLNEIVVNNRLQVRGVTHLRVIDASIAPHAVSANTNQITMIIGFKGVDLILEF